MKNLLVCCALMIGTASLFAQQEPMKDSGPPASPPAKESITIAGKTITIDYSSPRVKGREGKIYSKDGLISHDPHYPVWRGGANEATTLHTDANLTIGDLKVPAGTYTLFYDISNPAQWTIIVSKATAEWGLDYDNTKDLGRVKMKMTKLASMVENLKYTLLATGGNKGTLNLTWENESATVAFEVH